MLRRFARRHHRHVTVFIFLCPQAHRFARAFKIAGESASGGLGSRATELLEWNVRPAVTGDKNIFVNACFEESVVCGEFEAAVDPRPPQLSQLDRQFLPRRIYLFVTEEVDFRFSVFFESEAGRLRTGVKAIFICSLLPKIGSRPRLEIESNPFHLSTPIGKRKLFYW